MQLIIGSYHEGRLTPAKHTKGDAVPPSILQELKGRFTQEYREANIALTQQQLMEAATPDQDVAHAVQSLDACEAVANSLGKYVTEWYSLYHPQESPTWVEVMARNVDEPGLQSLHHALKSVMETRQELLVHIETIMEHHYPNLAAVCGAALGARLLGCAGSAARLAAMSATTVQLLGAEQALFRHLRNRRSLPPKHGVLINHPFVQKVGSRSRGKMARAIANAAAIAIKVDYFHGAFVGDKLAAKVEGHYHALART